MNPDGLPFATLAVVSIFSLVCIFSAGRLLVVKYAKLLYWTLTVLVFGDLILLALRHYWAWQSSEFTSYFLPPYQGISYFAFYSLTKIFAPYLISFLASVPLLWILTRVNRKNQGVFFEEEEPHLAATAVFLTGYPGCLIYFLVLTSAYLVWHIVNRLRKLETERLPLYHLWMGVGVLTILLGQFWLSHTQFWALLKI